MESKFKKFFEEALKKMNKGKEIETAENKTVEKKKDGNRKPDIEKIRKRHGMEHSERKWYPMRPMKKENN